VQPVRRSPLTDRYALYEPGVLDVDAMNAAVCPLLGEHDFVTFGQPPQGENSVRCLKQAEWQVVSHDLLALEPQPMCQLVFTITANAFLRHMVRNLVGSLLEVGRGRWPVEAVNQALVARERSQSAPPAPARGLVLERVNYPEPWSLFS
jgi:tRNA pseudouridine38-40 synthase